MAAQGRKRRRRNARGELGSSPHCLPWRHRRLEKAQRAKLPILRTCPQRRHALPFPMRDRRDHAPPQRKDKDGLRGKRPDPWPGANVPCEIGWASKIVRQERRRSRPRGENGNTDAQRMLCGRSEAKSWNHERRSTDRIEVAWAKRSHSTNAAWGNPGSGPCCEAKR